MLAAEAIRSVVSDRSITGSVGTLDAGATGCLGRWLSRDGSSAMTVLGHLGIPSTEGFDALVCSFSNHVFK